MTRLRKIWLTAALSAVLLGITSSLFLGGAFAPAAATGAAPAATPNATASAVNGSTAFGCRASDARVVLAGTVLAEPSVANSGVTFPNTPCNDDTTLVQAVNLAGNSSVLGNLGTVGPAGASTYETGSQDGNPMGATSIANLNAVTLNLGGYTIKVVGPAQAQAIAGCEKTGSDTYATTPYLTGSSNLQAITITGPGLPAAGETLDLGNIINSALQLPAPLNSILSITANEQTASPAANPTSITERMLDIQLLLGNVQVVVGEAQASLPDNSVCTNNVPPTIITPGQNTTTPGTTTTQTITVAPGSTATVTTPANTTTTTVVEPAGTVPSYLQQCATGSVLDPTSGNCVIYDNGQTIFVSKPFKGPQGGTVVSLNAAKAKYKSSCLAGAGPNWVLLVTALNGVAKGTPSSDRILGLNKGQHIAGLAGDDCIDEQSANGKIVDGNGKDRIYVTNGTNRVVAGNGNNTIHGGNGKNWITDGTGDDYIYGGSLPNRIDAYGNEKHIFGGSSNDRIWTNSIRAFVSCGGGKANILFGREKIIAYGKKHGCQKLSRLK